jgi:hypothetical protein
MMEHFRMGLDYLTEFEKIRLSLNTGWTFTIEETQAIVQQLKELG